MVPEMYVCCFVCVVLCVRYVRNMYSYKSCWYLWIGNAGVWVRMCVRACVWVWKKNNSLWPYFCIIWTEVYYMLCTLYYCMITEKKINYKQKREHKRQTLKYLHWNTLRLCTFLASLFTNDSHPMVLQIKFMIASVHKNGLYFFSLLLLLLLVRFTFLLF
jgi:hypothetical protein